MKIIKYIVIGCCLIAMTGLVLYARACHKDAPPRLIAVGRLSDTVRIGDRVSCDVVVRCPWHRVPESSIDFTPVEGLEVLEAPPGRLVRIGPGTWDWRLSLVVAPCRLGPFQDLQAVVEVRQPGRTQTLQVPIPDIVIQSRFGPDEKRAPVAAPPLSADYLMRARSTPWILHTVLGLALCMLGALLVFAYMRRIPQPRKPWEEATDSIELLQARMPVDAQVFCEELSDIVRGYIETLYGVRAPMRTTPEFLAEMNRPESPMPPAHRPVLADFLVSADLVKFAQAAMAAEQRRNALQKARDFIAQSAEPFKHTGGEHAV